MWQHVAKPRVEKIRVPLPDDTWAVTQMLRLDELHVLMSGNKVFKLLPNIVAAKAAGAKGLLTFGGAFSNHIHATAAAGHHFNIPTIGVIRDTGALQTPTLKDAVLWGMQLHRVDRQTYRRRHDPEWLETLQRQYPGFMVIPEGGSNDLALQGCCELGEYIAELDIDHVLLACGTGATARGVALGLRANQQVHAVAVLPGITREIEALSKIGAVCWENYHAGGYATLTDTIRQCVTNFEAANAVRIDPVYTAKMLWAASDLFHKGELVAERTLLVHTGGLQGRRGRPDVFAPQGNNRACT